MVRMLEQGNRHAADGGDTKVRDRVQERAAPSVEEVRRLVEGPPRQIRWMRWLAAFVLILAGAGIATYVALNDDAVETTTQVPRTADGAEGWIESLEPQVTTVPRTADGLERWILYLDPKVPRTADGAEGWYESLEPQTVTVPRTADGLERWIEYLDPKVPRTADGTERWLASQL